MLAVVRILRVIVHGGPAAIYQTPVHVPSPHIISADPEYEPRNIHRTVLWSSATELMPTPQGSLYNFMYYTSATWLALL